MPVSIITSHGAARRDLLPARDLLGGVEARARARRQRRLDIVRPDAVEHDQLRIRGNGAERFGLGPGRDEEVAAARLVQRLHRLARAKAIAVGLDRRARRHAGAVRAASASWTEARSGRWSGEAGGACTPRLAGRLPSSSRARSWPTFPVAPVEQLDRQLDRLVEAIGVDAPRVGMAARLVEALHAASAAEQMLRRAGAEAVAGQRIAAGQQLEIDRAAQ